MRWGLYLPLERRVKFNHRVKIRYNGGVRVCCLPLVLTLC